MLIVVKQHGGSTGTGEACAKIVREVDHPNIQVNYDAGNVMDYLNVDPIPDILQCADVVRSFCIKDHRNWPKDEDCGPGLGEIDHYRLLHPVAFRGLKMPLCCENIFAPLVPRPETPEGIDELAARARALPGNGDCRTAGVAWPAVAAQGFRRAAIRAISAPWAASNSLAQSASAGSSGGLGSA